MTCLAIMRPREKLAESETMARELGFDPICASPLEIRTNESDTFDQFLKELEDSAVDLVILTSTTGVASMLELACRRIPLQDFINKLHHTKLVAIGPLTAKAIQEAGLNVTAMPTTHSSTGLVEMLNHDLIAGKRVFVLRSDHGEMALMAGLKGAGAIAIEIIVYRLVTVDSDALDRLIIESISGRVDAFAFTSSLSAQTFIEAAEARHQKQEIIDLLNSKVVAAMGTPTKDKLEGMGIMVNVVPPEATFHAMLLTIKNFL